MNQHHVFFAIEDVWWQITEFDSCDKCCGFSLYYWTPDGWSLDMSEKWSTNE